jgi:hypothetical protein
VFHELPRGSLVALANAAQTASQIKRLVVRHRFMEAPSYTICKTPVGANGLPFPP